MAYQWPADTDFSLWELDVLDRNCPVCGRMMHICDHRYRRFHTLDGPVQLICKLNHCPDLACPGHAKTKSPEREITLALPQMAIGWDVFCWIGHRRCSRHMAISLIQSELLDDYGIKPTFRRWPGQFPLISLRSVHVRRETRLVPHATSASHLQPAS
jgi:hypothetical protein